MFAKTQDCPVCFSGVKLNKDNSFPDVCPACSADLVNPGSELVRDTIECEHLKGALGLGSGELFITNKRVFWIARKEPDGGNILVSMITSKKADKVSVNFPLGEMDKIEDCKKGLRKGVTVHTKSGASYNFFCSKPQELKGLLEPLTVR